MKKFFSYDWARRKKVLGIAFLFALTLSVGEQVSSTQFLASSMDISIMPGKDSGESGLMYAFKTGDFDFADILQYGMYLIKMGGVLAGVIYMLMNVWAGIRYITGSVTAEEEDAKNTMVNALMGFGLAVFSWIFVDILLALVM